ncbi:MAG: cytochrome c [Acidobacteriaceae bacterium]|nr:cytochrome c [Acidobacteriaceae bacterium]
MHNQPRYKPFAESEFFSDHRSARPALEGTVARGHLRLDAARYTGKIGENDVTSFPFPITRADLARGQQRYNIYCSPCHSRVGDANGQVVRRGFRQPPSYHIPRLRQAAVGHFFDVITNGYGSMASYASRVSPDDRWRITAYIRALQLSQDATMADVPADQRDHMEAQPEQPTPQITNEAPPNPAMAMPGQAPAPQGARPPGEKK